MRIVKFDAPRCIACRVCRLVLASASAHEHHAPHKGTLVEFGEEFAHLELVIDAATGRVSAYVLDGEAEKSVRIGQTGEIEIKVVKADKSRSFTVTLRRRPMRSAAKRKATSEFAGENEKL